MYCQHCGSKIKENIKYCPNCGAEQKPEEIEYKFCQHCGEKIEKACVVCPSCGKQVTDVSAAQPQIVIQNTNQNVQNAVAPVGAKRVDKWIAFFLALFLGFIGAHKFYEGKVGLGILYIFTLGLFGIGWLVDTIVILFKPNPYYV